MSARTPRVVIITRPTELERVLAKHGTYAQAAFAMRTWGQDIEVVRERHERFEAALAEAGASLNDVIRTRIMLTDVSLWKDAASAHGEVFSAIRPVCTVVEVSGFVDPDWLVELEGDAVIG